MKTIADLTSEDLRQIGKDAAERAVAELRAAGFLREVPASPAPAIRKEVRIASERPELRANLFTEVIPTVIARPTVNEKNRTGKRKLSKNSASEIEIQPSEPRLSTYSGTFKAD